VLLAGPLVCAASQAVNDWFDRHVDAINEPDRPIPSGRIPGRWGLYIAILWTILSALLALALGPWVAVAAAIGLVLAWIYSAPPLRLKMNGWTGAAACAVGYEGIPWFTGAAVMLGGFPPWEIVAMAGLYSLGAHGIMTLNDFKAVEGDREMGIKSLPVTLGVDRAAKLACFVMALPQIAVFALLAWLDAPFYAAGIGLLFAAQIALMPTASRQPAGAGGLVQRDRHLALCPRHAALRLRAVERNRRTDRGPVMTASTRTRKPMGWLGIVRCGLVQVALGAVVVLTTSTLNRVMVVELALPAMLPGALVGWHYAVQLSRPRWGYGSDMGGARTPWIIGGMGVLALGGFLAAFATYLMGASTTLGVTLAIVAFTLIGVGVGASGTSLLALLATRVAPERRAAAATICWLMMIAGIAVTAGVSGAFLDPFTPERLLAVSAAVVGIAFTLTTLTLWRLESRSAAVRAPASDEEKAARPPFRQVIAEIWAETDARRFTIFVFASMLAYSMQDLILEPFAGHVFAMTPGQSTQMAGVQHGGVFVGMVLVGVACSGWARGRLGSLKDWTVGGCLASGAALAGIVVGAFFAPDWPIRVNVFLLGLANGTFAVAAIGSMMNLAGAGKARREGVRMGLWGAAQAIAFGLGGFLGAALVDVLRQVFETPASAYGGVFAFEAVLFLLAAVLASRIRVPERAAGRLAPAE
jgi:BCD family chlorophyll transporter-like MFS transporter